LAIEALCVKEYFDETNPKGFSARVWGQGSLSGLEMVSSENNENKSVTPVEALQNQQNEIIITNIV
jgi:hypothetical protein